MKHATTTGKNLQLSLLLNMKYMEAVRKTKYEVRVSEMKKYFTKASTMR
jgi:hypothetical protein